uniref:SET domain-containing protein n=1 Tax=Timema shepardi TaxID=629360 RepID=A0A7R9AMI6_TIMSH|nr:unnamed protein product [Timema shepardi]
MVVCENALLGRHLVATRDIKEGVVVLKELPLVAGPPQITPPVCLGCYRTLDLFGSRECVTCGWPLCSDKCGESQAHKPECHITSTRRGAKGKRTLVTLLHVREADYRALVTLLPVREADYRALVTLLSVREVEFRVSVKTFHQPHPTYQCLLVLRCLYQRDSNPDVWKKLQNLESHCEERRKTPRYEEDRVAVAQFVRRFFNLQDFSEEQILRVCGIVQVNGHEVPVTEPPHVAIYETASLLEHHCRPNCSKSFTSSGGLIIRTAEPILKGQHLSICYSDALWGTANRRHHLSETKFFWCTCERCADPTELGTFFSAIRCKNSLCDGYLLPEHPLLQGTPEETPLNSQWRCHTCQVMVPVSEVLETLEKVGRYLSSMEKGEPRSCERFQDQFENLLHPNHFYLTDVQLALAQLYGQDSPEGLQGVGDKDLQKKIKLCRKLLALVDHLVPCKLLLLETYSQPENRVRGVLMFELHAVVAEEARRRANRDGMNPGEFRDRTQEETNRIGMDPDKFIDRQLGHTTHTLPPPSLQESKRLLTDAAFLLQYEPEVLPEGKMAVQARKNLEDLNILLQNIHVTIGDSPI